MRWHAARHGGKGRSRLSSRCRSCCRRRYWFLPADRDGTQRAGRPVHRIVRSGAATVLLGLVVASVFYCCHSWCNRCKQPLKTSASGRWKWPRRCVPRPSMPSFPSPCRWPARFSYGVDSHFRAYGRRVRRRVDDRRQPAGVTRRLGSDLRPCRGDGIRAGAHRLSAVMLVFSSSSCLCFYAWRPGMKRGC